MRGPRGGVGGPGPGGGSVVELLQWLLEGADGKVLRVRGVGAAASAAVPAADVVPEVTGKTHPPV